MKDENIPNAVIPNSISRNVRKTNLAGTLDMVAGILLCLFFVAFFMNVVNGGRTQDAWMLLCIIPGVMAIVGGTYARSRKIWGLALAGSICAIAALLGIVSTVLIITSKQDFT